MLKDFIVGLVLFCFYSLFFMLLCTRSLTLEKPSQQHMLVYSRSSKREDQRHQTNRKGGQHGRLFYRILLNKEQVCKMSDDTEWKKKKTLEDFISPYTTEEFCYFDQTRSWPSWVEE